MIILIDLDGRLKFINQAGLNLFELPLNTIKNHYFGEIATLREQIEPIARDFEQAVSVGNSNFTRDVPWKLTSGEVRWLRWAFSTVLDADGNVHKWLPLVLNHAS